MCSGYSINIQTHVSPTLCLADIYVGLIILQFFFTSLVPRPRGRREMAWYQLLTHSQKNLGIRLRLEIVGKIKTCTSDIFPYYRKIQPFAS